MKIVVATDKFKGSLSSLAAGNAIAAGFARAFAGAAIDVVPVADGGDGTAEALTQALGGREIPREVTGPDGRGVAASYVLLRDGKTAVVELARASGLELVGATKNDVKTATTRGTGQLIGAALDAGARRILLAIGGSATNDAGTGALAALGARFLDAGGHELPPGGAALARLQRIEVAELQRRLHGASIEIASDVTNPLCGPNGASAVYGPQKGASPQDVRELDAALAHFADVAQTTTGAQIRDVPGAGAAGGVGGGFMALAGAMLVPGAQLVLETIDFAGRLAGASLVVTGEGRLDRQTLAGKTPAAVAAAAYERGIPVVALAGSVDCTMEDLERLHLETALPIVPGPMTLEEAQRRAAELLETAAERLARALRFCL